MPDAPEYAGKRVIVAGAASSLGIEVTQRLVDLGAEVHLVDAQKPNVAGIASFTECDLHDGNAIVAAIDKIGAYVNALFVCAPADSDALVDAVASKALPGSQIITNPEDVVATLSRVR
jgi:NAD(P)-dependent dehydrogenase (short-subunit alcohol dehydrogenase family)